ncbi:TPA: phage tail protein [Klebsiella pneumoniae]|nr:phage tail protein [Klebsiella pneumoniae]
MTVSTQVSRNEYTGNGATTQYDFTFRILDKSHLLVQTLDTSEGIVTLTLGTDYTVTGVNRYNGGKVVLTSALPAGYKISIERSTPVTQEASIRNQGGFFPEIHEDAFDKLTMLVQQAYGWWSGLSLRKPSWLANYYDALNNRIRNLRDPSLAQDAATKSYVDSGDIDLQQQITSNFNRSLRVPDSYINQLPSAQDRAWKGLGFDGAGQPKLQDPAGTGLWGYVPAIGSFEQGSLLTQRFEVLLWESTDEYWRWDGAMPKIVLPGSTPATAGGTGKGKWIDITDATLRSNLGSSESDLGGALVNIGQATVRDVVRANILSYMSKTDQLAIKGAVGTEVVLDYALQAAINDGVTVLECPPVPGIYVFGQSLITLPIGFSFEGKSRRTYTAYSDASFNNVGTVFRLFNGASAIFKLTSRHTFRQVVFDGRNKSVRFMQGDDQTQWCRFYDCGIHRWRIGIGNSSPNGYSATLIVSGGTISSNTIGVRNVIDSLFLGVTINANEENGVELMTGANNNSFIGVRNEWNNGDNYFGYGCKRILIQGELIDRAGKRAVAATGGAQFTLSGVAVQRSGRLATEGSAEDAHFYLEGDASSIILTAVYTTTGANDDGSGRQSPSYLLATGGKSSDGKNFIASASILSGYGGSSWLRSGYIKGLSVIGCTGVEDVKNFGLRRIEDGVQYLGDAVPSLSLSGAGNTATLTFTTTSQTFPRYTSDFLVRTLEFRVRNNINTGAVAYYSVNLIIYREQYAANVRVDTASVRTLSTLGSGTWGVASASPTGVSLDFAISEDGTTLTVTLTAIDSASRIINARLRA